MSLINQLDKQVKINRKLHLIAKKHKYATVDFNLPLPVASQSLRRYNALNGGFFAKLVARVTMFFIG